MKKLLIFTSIILLIIIIIELVYVSTRIKTPNIQSTAINSNSFPLLKKIGISLYPTRPNIPIPSDYDPPSNIMVEGEVYYLQAMNNDDFIYNIRLIKPDGKAHEVLFEEMHKDIISVVKVDSNTNEQVQTTFEDIDLHDKIKVEFFIDLDRQRENTRSITANKILITIYEN